MDPDAADIGRDESVCLTYETIRADPASEKKKTNWFPIFGRMHTLANYDLPLPLLAPLPVRIRCKQNSMSSTIPAHQSIVVKTTIERRTVVALWKTCPTMAGNGRDFDDRDAPNAPCKSTDLLSSLVVSGFARIGYGDFGGSDVEPQKGSVPSSRMVITIGL